MSVTEKYEIKSHTLTHTQSSRVGGPKGRAIIRGMDEAEGDGINSLITQLGRGLCPRQRVSNSIV